MTAKIDKEDNTLICPTCGGNNLHHGTVEIYEAFIETTVNGTRTSCRHVKPGEENHNYRGNSLRINFDCERCRGGKSLLIAQHKGSTYVEWELL